MRCTAYDRGMCDGTVATRFCEYHETKFQILRAIIKDDPIPIYEDCEVVSLSGIPWDRILTLADLQDTMYIWEAFSNQPISCCLLKPDWLGSLSGSFIHFGSIWNWLQVPAYADFLTQLLMKEGYFVTDEIGQRDFEADEIFFLREDCFINHFYNLGALG